MGTYHSADRDYHQQCFSVRHEPIIKYTHTFASLVQFCVSVIVSLLWNCNPRNLKIVDVHHMLKERL